MSDIKLRYIIIDELSIKEYLTNSIVHDDNLLCDSLYKLMGVECVEIGDTLLQTIKPFLPRSYEEISYEEALYGPPFFGDIRDEIKVWKDSTTGDKLVAYTDADPDALKTKVEFTDELKGYVISFMYKFAKEIIEAEYSKRLKYIRNVSELEASTWEIQKHEAREWLTYGDDESHKTPFLDYIAKEREFDKTALSNKILEKAEAFQDKLSTTLVESQLLLKKFESCTTIKELNVLYEDYFGIMMPTEQAIELGRAHDGIRPDGEFSEYWKGTRMAWFSGSDGKTMTYSDPGTGDAKYLPDIINPYFGNILNF